MDISDLKNSPIERAKSVFRQKGGLLRMSQALQAGIHRDTLRAMVEQGDLEKLSRGLYRLADAEPLSHPDLAVVAEKAPEGVICLVSALAFHELTTQIPHEVYLAIARNAEPPRIDYPPVRSFRFSGAAFTEGIETHELGPVTLRVYSRAKTLADCFKFRNKIGLDTCLEALRNYRQQRGFNSDALLQYAAICRVTNIMRPYIEAVL
jgi:predicted transcriptional regulator of viral defense system